MRRVIDDSATNLDTDILIEYAIVPAADPIPITAIEDDGVSSSGSRYGTQYTSVFTWADVISVPTDYFTEVATEGDDAFWGTPEDDNIDALGGNDIIFGSLGADQLDGGDGFDTVNYFGSALGVSLDMARGMGFTGDAAGDTYAGIEHVIGSQRGDVIVGDHNGMTLEGGGGDDWLSGGFGNDRIVGGAGNDTLRGDIASGTVRLPGGVDQFVLGFDTGLDLIVDFEQGKDKIVIQGVAAEDAFGRDHVLARGFYDADRDLHSDSLSREDRLFYDVGTNELCEVNLVFHDGDFLGYRMDPIAQFTTDVDLRTYDFDFF